MQAPSWFSLSSLWGYIPQQWRTIQTNKQVRMSTFNAVFVPTFLSIIGVIFYLRLGYIVGSVGVGGTILIIFLAFSVTFTTALSLSSITTNIKIGDGGAYSIISKSLGLEVGGSVGIPLYLAQIFSVSLYTFGFAEGRQYLFPSHPTWIVLLCSFSLLFALISVPVSIALQIQKGVFALILISLLAVLLPIDWVNNISTISLTGNSSHSFWWLFALFFPAVTGQMAGIGLSGELENPRKQIPQGVLAATIITTIIYLIMVIWFGQAASSQELVSNQMVIVDYAWSGLLVLSGLLGATYSSALTTFLAAPRLLAGMAAHNILPRSQFLAKKTVQQIPLHATIVTGLAILATFLLGGIDTVAPILTMFFLITYSAINTVVFMEQSLGLPSFRPKLKIPKIIPLYGALSSIGCMFLINGFAAIISLVLLLIVYVSLIKKNLVSKEGDMRSGLFMLLAEWAAKKIMKLPESQKHVWKPSILFPTMTSNNLRGHYPILHGIIFPNGTLTVLGMQHAQGEHLPEEGELSPKLREQEIQEILSLVNSFGEEDIFTSFSDISVADYANGICISLEAIEGQVFHPNVLFLAFSPETLPLKDLKKIYETAGRHKVGVLLFSPEQNIWLGSQKELNVWIPQESIESDINDKKSYDLAMLLGFILHKNWNAEVRLCMATKKKDLATSYLQKLITESRFPTDTQIYLADEVNAAKAIPHAPAADLEILAFPLDEVNTILTFKNIGKSILFVTDAGGEDILS